jgi:NADH-quinone oxidoreductase subunit L
MLTLLILLIPLLLFLVLSSGGRRLSPRAAGRIGTAGMALATLTAYLTAWIYFFATDNWGEPYTGSFEGGPHRTVIDFSFEWLRFNDTLHIDLGALLDPISVVMLVVITTVSLMVHL